MINHLLYKYTKAALCNEECVWMSLDYILMIVCAKYVKTIENMLRNVLICSFSAMWWLDLENFNKVPPIKSWASPSSPALIMSITRKHKHMLDVVLAYTNKYCIDSEAKCRVVIKELTKLFLHFVLRHGAFYWRDWGVFLRISV